MPSRRVQVGDKMLFRVDVEERRSSTFWVVADSQTEAEAEAKILGNELNEWDEIEEIDITTVPASTEPDNEDSLVWMGGETGQWWHWEEVNG